LVLEHLLECLEGKSLTQLTQDFFGKRNLCGLSFEQKTLPRIPYASGFTADGREVEGSRKMFPAFAAGAMGTAAHLAGFLMDLTYSYRSLSPTAAIRHETAVTLLHPTSTLSRDFMGADIGLGVFLAEAGRNRLALHQGANDGFRSLFIQCYDGPERGRGLVIFCNGDHGAQFVAEAAQLILAELKISGIEFDSLAKRFSGAGVPSEQVVNQTYREMIFKGFQPDLPEAIVAKGGKDPLAPYNLAVNAKILAVNNQGFARAENLLSEFLPVFDPELFGRQGKVMDSWETVRHNPGPGDWMILELPRPAEIRYISISTRFHLGNHSPFLEIEGRTKETESWRPLLAKTPLDGHALKNVLSDDKGTVFRQIRVSIFPDGGVTRLGLYGNNLPEGEKKKFLRADVAKSLIFEDPIPKSARPLTPHYHASAEEIQQNWAAQKPDSEVDFASSALGGVVLSATNEHFAPAAQIISPFPPLNMFDGFESARSRERGHFEEVVIQLGGAAQIHRLQMDFTYFRNNNPREVSVQTLVDGKPVTLVAKTSVKAYAGNRIEFPIHCLNKINQITIRVFPDGGINRVRVFGMHS
jgi:allantoicase